VLITDSHYTNDAPKTEGHTAAGLKNQEIADNLLLASARSKPTSISSTFPLLGAMGTENSATVYFKLDPSDTLGWHTYCVEKLLLILAGTVEVFVGEEQGQLSQGELALLLAACRNGEETAVLSEITFIAGNNSFNGPDTIPAGWTQIRLQNDGPEFYHVQ
jgi:quercetin dioxygenase-like cupin family protein